MLQDYYKGVYFHINKPKENTEKNINLLFFYLD